MNKPIFRDFEVEFGESISIDLKNLPEYPHKFAVQHNEAFYYIYKLYNKIIIERSVISNESLPTKAFEK